MAEPTEQWEPLIDVSGLSITEIVSSNDAILDRCLKRVVAEVEDPDGIISAFQSFIT